jgi:hypothetical protein
MSALAPLLREERTLVTQPVNEYTPYNVPRISKIQSNYRAKKSCWRVVGSRSFRPASKIHKERVAADLVELPKRRAAGSPSLGDR